MSDFPIGDTATVGFRVIRDRPLILAYWFGATLLFSLGAAALMFTVAGSAFTDIVSQSTATTPQAPEQALALVGRVLGAIGLLLPLYLLFGAVMTTAANRAVLEPDNSAFGYLRVGADELRTLVVLVAVAVLVVVAYMVLAILVGLIFGGAVMGGAAAGGNLAGGLFAGLLMLVMIPALIAAVAYFATRMSLAVPQTFDTKSINIFGTWKLTKGNTGKLFLAYLLAFLIYFGISMVGGLLNLALGLGGRAGILGAASKAGDGANTASLLTLMGPTFLLSLVISGVVSTLGLAVMVCPSAQAYRLLGRRPTEAAEVFA
jgi:hypothetical protein